MKSDFYRFFLIGRLFALLSAGGAIAFFVCFHAALGQEKDTPEVLKAVAVMELTQSNIRAIASNPNRLLVRSSSSLRTYLEKQGWTHKEQFGAVALYQKGSDRLNVSCIAYSGRYIICTLHQSRQ